MRRRRRGGGDRPARDELALEQVPEPGARRRRPSHPPPERLQDRERDGARADSARRARQPDARLRLGPPLRRRQRPGDDAPAHGGLSRPGARHRPRRPDARARFGKGRTAPVAHDRPRLAEGMDGSEDGGRQARRGDLAGTPGAARQDPRESRAPAAPRGLDAELPARRALRRERQPAAGAAGPRAEGRKTDGGESARERRSAPRRPRRAGLGILCRRGPETRRRGGRGDARHGPLPARHPRAATLRRATSGFSHPTRRSPIAGETSSR